LREKARVEKCGAKIFQSRVDGALLVTKAFGDFSFKSHVGFCELGDGFRGLSRRPARKK